MLVQSPLGIVHHAAPIPEYGHTCHAFHIDHFRDHDRIARTVMKIRQAGLAIHREGTKADTGRVERVPVTPQRANARVRAVIAPRVVSIVHWVRNRIGRTFHHDQVLRSDSKTGTSGTRRAAKTDVKVCDAVKD